MQTEGPVPDRYSRQVLFAGLGAEGQRALMRSRVAIVGCGGLGSTQASLLVRAGVGLVRLIDRDAVDETNLHRQILYDEADATGLEPKATIAARKLREVNSQVRVEGLAAELNAATVGDLLADVDVILDACDNFATRYVINDFAVKMSIPWVHGGCVASYGMTFAVVPGETACLRCVFAAPPPRELTPTSEDVGVIGPIVVAIAALQTAEALKLAAGRREALSHKITTVDLWQNTCEQIDLPPADPRCPCCGERRFDYL
ncbi:MAG TPA: ThiF family adenylyltransferase [Thermoleophilia bacterium]|nr:ThiF family adenylyltransferase [Thermoleophilia bacterium]